MELRSRIAREHDKEKTPGKTNDNEATMLQLANPLIYCHIHHSNHTQTTLRPSLSTMKPNSGEATALMIYTKLKEGNERRRKMVR